LICQTYADAGVGASSSASVAAAAAAASLVAGLRIGALEVVGGGEAGSGGEW